MRRTVFPVSVAAILLASCSPAAYKVNPPPVAVEESSPMTSPEGTSSMTWRDELNESVVEEEPEIVKEIPESKALDQQFQESRNRHQNARKLCLDEYNNSEYTHVNGKDYVRYAIKGSMVHKNFRGELITLVSPERPLECEKEKGRINEEETFVNSKGCTSRYLFKVEGKYLVRYSNTCIGSENRGITKESVGKLRLSASNENVDEFFDNMLQ